MHLLRFSSLGLFFLACSFAAAACGDVEEDAGSSRQNSGGGAGATSAGGSAGATSAGGAAGMSAGGGASGATSGGGAGMTSGGAPGGGGAGGGAAGASAGGASGGEGGASATAGMGGGSGEAGSGGAAGNPCDDLVKAIDDLRPKARECCLECRTLQCTMTVDDLCCPLSATNVDPQFVELVAQYKQTCPPYPCPEIACPPAPSGMCRPQNGMPKGACD